MSKNPYSRTAAIVINMRNSLIQYMGDRAGDVDGAHRMEGRGLYEAIEYVLKEAQIDSAPLPFDIFLSRVEQLLGRELTENEENRMIVTAAMKGMLWSDDEKYGRVPVGFEILE